MVALARHGWHVAMLYYRGIRSARAAASWLFAHCPSDDRDAWIAEIWTRVPHPQVVAINRLYKTYMAACDRATLGGVGAMPTQAWGVTAEGVITGFA